MNPNSENSNVSISAESENVNSNLPKLSVSVNTSPPFITTLTPAKTVESSNERTVPRIVTDESEIILSLFWDWLGKTHSLTDRLFNIWASAR